MRGRGEEYCHLRSRLPTGQFASCVKIVLGIFQAEELPGDAGKKTAGYQHGIQALGVREWVSDNPHQSFFLIKNPWISVESWRWQQCHHLQLYTLTNVAWSSYFYNIKFVCLFVYTNIVCLFNSDQETSLV